MTATGPTSSPGGTPFGGTPADGPAPATPPTSAGATARRRRVAVLPLLALLAAVVVGAVAGYVTAAVVTAVAPPREGFADLAAVVTGILAAWVVGAVGAIVGLVVVARRLFPPGRRAAVVLLGAVGTAAMVFLAAAVQGSVSNTAADPALFLAILVLALVTPSVVFSVWDRMLRPVRRLGT